MKEINNSLRYAFPDMPESIRQAVMDTARAVREEEKMKRFSIKTLAIAALIIVLTMALAYAAFHSQVAEYFGKKYGEDTKNWLEQGQTATPGTSLTLNGVTFAMEEVIYRNKGLYGLIRFSGEKAGQASVFVDRIGVDGGEMMTLPVYGYDEDVQADGSVLHAFEASDATVIGEGKTYTLGMLVKVEDETRDWVLTVEPKKFPMQTEKASAPESAVTFTLSGVPVSVPEGYQKAGTLPVFKAQPRDFGKSLRPELFNQSGLAEQKDGFIVFMDESTLSWEPEALYYGEYKGTYNGNYKEKNRPEMPIPMPTLSHTASRLSNHVHFGWYESDKQYADLKLEKTELSGISMEMAKARVESLLTELDLEGYTCVWALDMDIERIKTLGESENAWIRNSPSNAPIVDYSLVSKENEGFYLHYENGVENSSEGNFVVTAYVTGKGIITFTAQDPYQKGEIVSQPEKLVEADSILKRLPGEIAESRFSEMTVREIISLELIYAPARAKNKAEGMVLTPAWLIKYYDTDQREYEAYAVFNAVEVLST